MTEVAFLEKDLATNYDLFKSSHDFFLPNYIIAKRLLLLQIVLLFLDLAYISSKPLITKYHYGYAIKYRKQITECVGCKNNKFSSRSRPKEHLKRRYDFRSSAKCR